MDVRTGPTPGVLPFEAVFEMLDGFTDGLDEHATFPGCPPPPADVLDGSWDILKVEAEG